MNNFYKGKIVLVTGGTGFVGRHLVSELYQMGSQVYFTGKDDNSSRDISNNEGYINLDICNYEEVRYLLRQIRPNIIFHLAAIVSATREFDIVDEMIEVNLRGTTNILRAVEGINDMECIINFGSTEEYGDQNIELNEIIREEPRSPYAILKMASTRFCNMFSSIYNIPIITVRPANIFGPGQPIEKIIPYIILKGLRNSDINMTYGEQKRNFIYVEDFLSALY